MVRWRCADGNYAPMYVEVTVQGQMDFLFDLPGMPDAAAITGFSRMRVK